MASSAQIAANRRNAQRSSGPVSAEGKDKVSRNATKHGILSGRKFLPGEDPEEFASLERNMRDALKPVGALEELLVERIVNNTFRLRRLGRVEAGLLAYRIYDTQARMAERDAHRLSVGGAPNFLDLPDAGKEEAYAAAVHEIELAENLRDDDLSTLGRAFLTDQQGFSTLSRYESTLERGIFRALHELERVQRTRAGDAVPVPIAVDVDVVERAAEFVLDES